MTTIAIVGGAGRVARALIPQAREAGFTVVPLARGEAQRAQLEALGTHPRHLDIEAATIDDAVAALAGCHAVVFTAGGGPDGNIERKRTVDLGGALMTIDAAHQAGISRLVQVSAWGVDQPVPDDASEVWHAYVEAKRDSDAAVRASGLDWTIVRPGGLTDDAGTGRVTLAPQVERGQIPRADVAAVIVECLRNRDSIGHQWELVEGATTVAEAVAAASVQ